MNETFLISIMATGFAVAFFHAAIPTHWLPFVLAGRGQGWSKTKTLMVVALCGSGHVLFTTMLGVLVVWLGTETSKWTGEVFPWIAGGALILFGLYYLIRQARGHGHGHSHFGPGGGHGHHHDAEIRQIETDHGVFALEVFEDAVPPRFRIRNGDGVAPLPRAETTEVETVRPDGVRQTFAFVAREGFLESSDKIPEPHEFVAHISLAHGEHIDRYEARFEEHEHPAGVHEGVVPRPTSDRAVLLGLFTLLTFSPCEGFLPIYLSGIRYGWAGFAVLSVVLASATLAGMLVFTALTMAGLEKFKLQALEKYESAILGALLSALGVAVIVFEV